MLAAERQSQIAQLIACHHSVTVADLCQRFAVSDMTVRRDLQRLEKEGILARTHGGAVACDTAQDAAYGVREQAQQREKEAIARAAAALVQDGETLFLDAGTTTAGLARYLHGKDGLTVITNSLHVLRELGGDEQITLIGTGGMVRQHTLSFVGAWAEEMISRFYADRLFLAAAAIDPERGVFNSNAYEIGTKQQMIRCTREVLVLADHSKFERRFPFKITDFDSIHGLITDDRAASDILAALCGHNMNVLEAK